MSISKYPSKLSLPQSNPGVTTVLEYLLIKFPDINSAVWQQRMNDGKVHWHDGTPITPLSPFKPQQRIYYYREVENEPITPFKEQILFEDQHLLVAFKPHFLALMPGGIFVNECLQHRLRIKTGNEALQALHRLDRVTAGLVMFSSNPETRSLYHNLFKNNQIQKTYQAIAKLNNQKPLTGEPLVGQQWQVKNRIVKSELNFRMRIVEGEANSHSSIRCIAQSADKALFELNPITGKRHQLRLHMHSLGWPILNDKYYPSLQPKSADDYSKTLQLLAKELRFIDPVTQQPRVFTSNINLTLSNKSKSPKATTTISKVVAK